MFPGVELRLYRYVAAIAEELNFTRASEKLHVAQPALSRQIKQLEEYLGTLLFERDRRGVRLTPAGEAFTAEARQTLFHAQRAVEGARAAKGQHKGPWRLGYTPLLDRRILAKVRQHFSATHPTADIRLASSYTSEQADSLMRGKLQAGLVILPIREEGLTSEGFHRQALVLALPEHHPLADRVLVELSDLDKLPLVVLRGDLEPRFGEDLKRIFAAARVQPRILNEATTQAEALEFVVDEGVAALTMPSAENLRPEGVVFRNFADEFLTAEVGLAYLADNGSVILASLRKFLAETFKPLGVRASRDRQERQMALF